MVFRMGRESKGSPGLWATRLEKRLPAWHFCGPKALARCHNLIQTKKKIAREKNAARELASPRGPRKVR